MPEIVSVHDAKTHLSKLLRRVEQGEEIIIGRAGEPVARLVAYEKPRLKKRKLGTLAGKLVAREDFDEPLPDELLKAFYFGPVFPDEDRQDGELPP